MERTDITIHDLHKEMIEEVFQFLHEGDLNACYSVCQRWRWILIQSRIWKKYCIYPEKYFLKKPNLNLESGYLYEQCPWRKQFKQERRVLKNFSEGSFVVEKTGISLLKYKNHWWFVDDHGNHWFVVQYDSDNFEIWNITNVPVLHCKFSQIYHSRSLDLTRLTLYYVKNKLLIIHPGFTEVFQFMYPDYNLTLQYKILLDGDAVLSSDQLIPDHGFRPSLSQIIVDEFLVGYSEFLENIHIWNVVKGQKAATQITFQQSLVEFVGLQGNDRDERRELSLIGGGSGKLLVKITDTINKKCQISLFCLHSMKFVHVVAQLPTPLGFCCMEGDMVVMEYLIQANILKYEIALYNIIGQVFSNSGKDLFHPEREQMFFCDSKIFVKFPKKIHVIAVVNLDLVWRNILEIEETDYILCYFKPRFLVTCRPHRSEVNEIESNMAIISVWDIDLGEKLWEVKNVHSYFLGFSHYDIKYPGKLILQLSDSLELSILDFEKDGP